jgi:cholesterol transport system auxiliary component
MKKLWAVAATLLLAACSFGPTSRETPATYDLGAPRSYADGTPRIHASLLVNNVAAPGWLDTQGIVYRLNFQDAARQQTYAGSRWAASPAVLLTQRLRSRLAAASDVGVIGAGDSARADYVLRVELEEFSQVFDAADASRAVVIARASLIDVSKRALHAQKSFSIERAAPNANAEGGVRSLAAAGDELIEAVTAWTAASLARDKK